MIPKIPLHCITCRRELGIMGIFIFIFQLSRFVRRWALSVLHPHPGLLFLRPGSAASSASSGWCPRVTHQLAGPAAPGAAKKNAPGHQGSRPVGTTPTQPTTGPSLQSCQTPPRPRSHKGAREEKASHPSSRPSFPILLSLPLLQPSGLLLPPSWNLVPSRSRWPCSILQA